MIILKNAVESAQEPVVVDSTAFFRIIVIK
jgi:hypothetical protein